jgi:hypothetical protein
VRRPAMLWNTTWSETVSSDCLAVFHTYIHRRLLDFSLFLLCLLSPGTASPLKIDGGPEDEDLLLLQEKPSVLMAHSQP